MAIVLYSGQESQSCHHLHPSNQNLRAVPRFSLTLSNSTAHTFPLIFLLNISPMCSFTPSSSTYFFANRSFCLSGFHNGPVTSLLSLNSLIALQTLQVQCLCNQYFQYHPPPLPTHSVTSHYLHFSDC